MPGTRLPVLVIMLAALSGVTGCAGPGGPAALSLPPIGTAPPAPSAPATETVATAVSEPAISETGANPILSLLPAVNLPAGAPKPIGSPTEIYTRVARGILSCWFGAKGPLKPSYIYHAEAQPPSKGGASVIDIHTRDKAVTDPRSIRAWRVAIQQGPEGPVVAIENIRLPEPFAGQLEADVWRWAAAQDSCGADTIAADGSTGPATPTGVPALLNASSKPR